MGECAYSGCLAIEERKPGVAGHVVRLTMAMNTVKAAHRAALTASIASYNAYNQVYCIANPVFLVESVKVLVPACHTALTF